MRLTILGRSPASPNPGEACAGYLVEGGGARLLVDIGPGVVSQLVRRHHPDELDAVVISHMHADHMLDLVTLRYVYPWRERPKDQRLRVFVPPGSADQLLDLAKGAGNAKHFESCFRVAEHDGASSLAFGGITMTPVRTQHYIPCWGFRMEADGRRLAYTADTAPCRRPVRPRDRCRPAAQRGDPADARRGRSASGAARPHHARRGGRRGARGRVATPGPDPSAGRR